MLGKSIKQDRRPVKATVFGGAVWLALMSAVWIYAAKVPAPIQSQAPVYSAALLQR
jgi:hypothetical protein